MRARTRAQVAARAVLSPLAVGLAARAKAAFTGRGLIATHVPPFVPACRFVVVPFVSRSVTVPWGEDSKIVVRPKRSVTVPCGGYTMNLQWPPKSPEEVNDYDVVWSEALCDGDTILTSIWSSSPAGITIENDSHSPTITKVWLSGGVVGQNYAFVNTITTVQGRTLDQTINIYVEAT